MKIEIISAIKNFGSLKALDEVSMMIEPGQVVAVLGPNGAGKTTLFRVLSGIMGLGRGEVRYDGELFRRDRMDLRRKLMFLPDFPFVFAHMNAIRHIGMVMSLYGLSSAGREEKVVQLLEDFDLLPMAEIAAGQLSRGQIYKTALVGLLTIDPEVWILDEPFASGMDPHGISMFKKHVQEAVSRGRTILYSTQILDLAERFSDRVCVIHQGKIRAFDKVEKLAASHDKNKGPLEELFQQLREEKS